jgi:vacuolar-type H+-ATPase subunit H
MFEDKFINLEADLVAKINELAPPAELALEEARTRLANLEEKFQQYRAEYEGFASSKGSKARQIAEAVASGADPDAAYQGFHEEELRAKEKLEIADHFERSHIPAARALVERRKKEVEDAYNQARKIILKQYLPEVKAIADELLEIDAAWQRACEAHTGGCGGKFFLPVPYLLKQQLNDHFSKVVL